MTLNKIICAVITMLLAGPINAAGPCKTVSLAEVLKLEAEYMGYGPAVGFRPRSDYFASLMEKSFSDMKQRARDGLCSTDFESLRDTYNERTRIWFAAGELPPEMADGLRALRIREHESHMPIEVYEQLELEFLRAAIEHHGYTKEIFFQRVFRSEQFMRETAPQIFN